MSAVTRCVLIASFLVLAPSLASGQNNPDSATGVWVNRVQLTPAVVEGLEREFGVHMLPGDYWYDSTSGLFGLMGGPGLGFTMAGLQVGGSLPQDASGRGTRVFVNGRELHSLDVAVLMALLGAVVPGRYWLRHDGYYGYEGGPPMGNLITIAQRASGAGYNRSTYSGHLGSDGETSYFFDPNSGCSVISGGGVSC